MLVIVDSSPVILLSRLGLLSILDKLYERVIVPEEVFREVVKRGSGLPGSQELEAATWVEVKEHDSESALYRSLGGELGSGEAAALALSVSLGADLLVIDERQGRLAAQRLGMSVKDTVGVLVAAKREGLIPELRPVLDDLIRQGAWLSPSLREAALLAVNEEGASEEADPGSWGSIPG